ncbi:MAG: formylmethanofuran dehydrogenase subunit B [Gemmatimonadota bacterium]|nr:formylmethanofuran dehydrogenase subunit B [Gemmatimonadota bacterium]
MPTAPLPPGTIHDVTCPFCGLVCDDLVVETTGPRLHVVANGCPLAVAGFERDPASDGAAARVGGRPATVGEAVTAAARLLCEARQPVLAGLATDVAGARAATQLAERAGAVLDHMNSAAGVRNLLVLQDSGWITTTLSEVRNHADLLIVAGADIARRMPRFFERCIGNRETLFGGERRCDVVYLGRGPGSEGAAGASSTVIECEVIRLHEAFAVLKALAGGRTIGATEAAGVPMARWRELAERCRAARYGVIAWMAADLDFPQADLTVQGICEFVRDLNRHTRFAGLPLGGSEGETTADAVLLWQSGFGLRTSLAGGSPDQDVHHYSAERMVRRGETDLLLWVSSFNAARTPPASDIPTIVLGRAGMTLSQEPAVFIAVGTPGVEHAGHLFRTDRVVALPLRALRPSPLPSAAEVLTAIDAAMRELTPC